MKVDLHTVAAFNRLKLPEMEPVLTYMRALRTDTLEGLAQAGDDDQLRRLQGRARVLQELLDLVLSSDELAAKLSRPRP